MSKELEGNTYNYGIPVLTAHHWHPQVLSSGSLLCPGFLQWGDLVLMKWLCLPSICVFKRNLLKLFVYIHIYKEEIFCSHRITYYIENILQSKYLSRSNQFHSGLCFRELHKIL